VVTGCKAATPRAARLALGAGVIENERGVFGVLSEADRRGVVDRLFNLQIRLPPRCARGAMVRVGPPGLRALLHADACPPPPRCNLRAGTLLLDN
jgi:hypothetical protein